jgi:hypothetical protein
MYQTSEDISIEAEPQSPDFRYFLLLPESLGGAKVMGTAKETKAPEGTAVGVTAGGVIGGTPGLLAGVGLLAILASARA